MKFSVLKTAFFGLYRPVCGLYFFGLYVTINLLIYRLAMGSCSYFDSKTFLQLSRKGMSFRRSVFTNWPKFSLSCYICFCFNQKFVLLRGIASSVSSCSPEWSGIIHIHVKITRGKVIYKMRKSLV